MHKIINLTDGSETIGEDIVFSAEHDAAVESAWVRSERDNILATVVDPLVSNNLRWADLTAAKQAEWTQYRTDLLNVPDQAGFPTDITWPTKPD